MRLFLGFAPAAAERELFSLCDSLVLPRDLDLRFVPPENWHITLAFLGDVPESLLGKLSDVADSAARGAVPLSVDLNELAWFPSALKPRLLALMVGASPALLSLQAGLVASLRRAGFHSERREYRPHLTLARMSGSAKGALVPPLPPVRPLSVALEAIGLYQSWRGERPYRLLQQFELRP